MKLNFVAGEGSITSTHLSGNVNINLEDGTFMHGEMMNLKETADSVMIPAELYGSFHSTEASGVSGVFHEASDSPNIMTFYNWCNYWYQATF